MTPDEAIEEFYPMVQWLAKRYATRTGGRVEVDDLVQEGLMGVVRAVSKWDPQGGRQLGWFLRTELDWTMTGFIEKQMGMGRKGVLRKGREETLTRQIEQRLVDAGAEERAIERMDRQLAIERVRLAIAGLSEPQRKAVEAVYWGDKDKSEVARELGVSHQAIGQRLKGAMEKLAGMLRGE